MESTYTVTMSIEGAQLGEEHEEITASDDDAAIEAARFEAHLTELFPEVVVTVRATAGRDEFNMPDATAANMKAAMEDWDWLAALSAVCEEVN